MQYRNLGTSGLKVSSLCLGAMTFGEPDEGSFMHKVGSPEDESFAVLDRAVEAGINFIDTADVYGQDGLSERILGKWFTERGQRDNVVLATKMRFRMWDGDNGTGASRYRIMRCVEDSLRRMKTDRIDLYQIHMQDIDTPEDETLRALDDLVRQGKVLYIGASNYAAYRLTESQWISKLQNLERFVSLQMQYSMVVRDLEREHVPLCDKYGIGIIPWSPLAGGFLTGKYRKGQQPPAGTRLEKWTKAFDQYNNDRNWAILEALDAMVEQTGASHAQVALAWLLNKKAVSSVIFGARTLKQLEDNLGAATLALSDAQMAALDEASAWQAPYPYSMMGGVQGAW